MKKLLFSAIIAVLFCSCTKSPESAAAEVCSCYKSLGDTKLSEIATKTKDCTTLAGNYRKSFKDGELKAFTVGIADCVTGGLFK